MFLKFLKTSLLQAFLKWLVRKVGPNPSAPGTAGPLRPPRPRDPRYLRIPWTPGTPGPLHPLTLWDLRTSELLRNYLCRLKFRNKGLPKLYNWTITNQRGKLRVPSEVILFIELLTMIFRGHSPPLLPSSYVTFINRNDNQRHLIAYTQVEKISQFLTLQCLKISIKTPFFCYRYTKEYKYFHKFSKS